MSESLLVWSLRSCITCRLDTMEGGIATLLAFVSALKCLSWCKSCSRNCMCTCDEVQRCTCALSLERMLLHALTCAYTCAYFCAHARNIILHATHTDNTYTHDLQVHGRVSQNVDMDVYYAVLFAFFCVKYP
eukprot:3871640-Pleurochrysis_carterae.AAC.1